MPTLSSFKNGIPNNLENSYSQILGVSTDAIGVLAFAAMQDIEPIIQAELRLCYSRSGLKQRGEFESKNGDSPGKLFEMIVNTVKDQIVKSKLGITLRFPRGFPKSVYIRASVFTSGAVYGSKLKINRAGARFKKVLKSVVGKGVTLPHKVWVMPPKHLYEMTPAQKLLISNEFDTAFEKRYLSLFE